MSRFDRRLRGVAAGNDGPRPGTAACSLPASSTPNSALLGGNFINRSPAPVSRQRQINGVAMLQTHEQKIKKLELKLSGVELGMNINISRQESQTEQLQKQFNMLNSEYHTQIQALKDYIQVLEQKLMKNPVKKVTQDNSTQTVGGVKNISLVITEDN